MFGGERRGERRWACWWGMAARETRTRTLNLYSIPLPFSPLYPLIVILSSLDPLCSRRYSNLHGWMGAVRSFYCMNQPYFSTPFTLVHSFIHIYSSCLLHLYTLSHAMRHSIGMFYLTSIFTLPSWLITSTSYHLFVSSFYLLFIYISVVFLYCIVSLVVI